MFQNKSKKYVFLRSDDSSDVYPNNKAYHFKTHLNSPLVVREGCKVGVSEFHSPDDLSQLKTEMCIHSNICEESVLRSKEQSVLRILYPKSNTNISFNPIYYMHTRYSEIRDIEIYITDIHNNFCTFLKKPLSLTLCFK